MRKLALSAFVVVLLSTLTVPAWAHFTKENETWGEAGVEADHRYVWVCDEEENGNGVYLEWDSPPRGAYVWDPNGAKSGCGHRDLDVDVEFWRLCQDDWGFNTCTEWREA